MQLHDFGTFMPPVAALSRLGRQLDRMESRGAEYRQKLRAGFLAEVREMGGAAHVVDAGRAAEVVQGEIRELGAKYL